VVGLGSIIAYWKNMTVTFSKIFRALGKIFWLFFVVFDKASKGLVAVGTVIQILALIFLFIYLLTK
jgi:hypothetical protein